MVHCSFGLRVTYAPEIRVALDLPEAYRGHVGGLCADYNGDPSDDLWVPEALASPELPEDALAWAFGHSCLVDFSTGCPDAAAKMPPLPPSCITLSTTSTSAHFSHSCNILLDPQGPFSLCHELLAPEPYFQDCVVGVCQGTGPCPMLSLYCEACQLLGRQVSPWRKENLCSECPYPDHLVLPIWGGLGSTSAYASAPCLWSKPGCQPSLHDLVPETVLHEAPESPYARTLCPTTQKCQPDPDWYRGPLLLWHPHFSALCVAGPAFHPMPIPGLGLFKLQPPSLPLSTASQPGWPD